MSAEETLVFVRFEWRPLFDELMLALTSCADSCDSAIVDAIRKMSVSWAQWESIVLHVLSQTEESPEERHKRGVELVVEHAWFIISAVDMSGNRLFDEGYMTITLHNTVHLPYYELIWGRLYHHWCFKWERFAGVLTDMLVNWNHAPSGSMGMFIARRLSLRAAAWLW
jgi:hypothetical protein